MNISTLINLATLLTVIIYTLVTYRLLASQVKQGFESKFFQLLRFHHDIVGAIERYSGQLPIRGRRNFETFYGEFTKTYDARYQKNPKGNHLETLQSSYSAFFKSNQAHLGHYFRNLYHIFKFVDRSDVDDKNFYMHLVRAQMSSHELLLFFYNGLSIYGYPKFRVLIQDYALLENMSKPDLVSATMNFTYDDKSLYEARAFGDS